MTSSTLSQVRRGTIRHEPEHVELAVLLDGVRTDLGAEGSVELDVADRLAVYADRDHVRRILINYLENARKYGEPPITVTVRAVGDVIEIRVRDHGPGVDPEFVPALYDRFTQASMGLQRTAKGVGLGLSIVRTLAELNSGEAWYEHADPGAAFCLRLPRSTGVRVAPISAESRSG